MISRCDEHDRLIRAVEASTVRIEQIWTLMRDMDARQRALQTTIARWAGILAALGVGGGGLWAILN